MTIKPMSLNNLIAYLNAAKMQADRFGDEPQVLVNAPTDCLTPVGVVYDQDSNTLYIDVK